MCADNCDVTMVHLDLFMGLFVEACVRTHVALDHLHMKSGKPGAVLAQEPELERDSHGFGAVADNAIL